MSEFESSSSGSVVTTTRGFCTGIAVRRTAGLVGCGVVVAQPPSTKPSIVSMKCRVRVIQREALIARSDVGAPGGEQQADAPRTLFIIIVRLRVGGKVRGWIGCILPGLRRSQRRAEGSDERFHNKAVPTNENRVGDARELQQHGAKPGIEPANVDTSGHPRRLSVLGPNVDAIAILVAPPLELRCP